MGRLCEEASGRHHVPPALISVKQHSGALFKIRESTCFLLWQQGLNIPEERVLYRNRSTVV
jgi:hypothetical protein